MTGQGRPLRFLAVLVVGWIGLRTAMLWPHAEAVPGLARATVIASVRVRATPATPIPIRLARAWRAVAVQADAVEGAPQPSSPPPLAPLAAPERDASPPVTPPAPPLPGLPRPATIAAAGSVLPSRFSGSFWLVARDGGGVTSAPLGGQLGGSQAGLRLAYLLDRTRRIAAMARVTSPLGSGLREAAIGLEWQPTRLPVRIVAEQRIAIDGGKGGPAAEVVGGFGPLPIGGGFRLDAYAQAGAIHRDRTEGFVDGAAHLAHPIGALGPIPFDLGAGLWGGAQRGAERLDIGPSLTATLPLAGRRLRLSLDWRERVVGTARPGSGVALTVGADF